MSANKEIDRGIKWSIALSVLMIAAGVLAIILPPVSGVAVTILVGWMLVLGGVAHLAMLGKGNNESEWKPIFEGLANNEAVLLPGVEEAGEKLRQFKLLPRLTSHVHHGSKYLDVPMIEGHSFVFTDDGNPVGAPAQTLKEFVSSLANCPPKVLDGHARRGDFSRWIADVVHDHSLALVIREVEQRYRLGLIHDIHQALARPIQTRYGITPEVSGQISLIRSGNAPVAGSDKPN